MGKRFLISTPWEMLKTWWQSQQFWVVKQALFQELKFIISLVGDNHGTFVTYGHVSFVKEVYPDDSFLLSETNVDGRRFSQVDSAMNFAYTTKQRVFT